MMAMLKLASRSAWARRLTLGVTLFSIAIMARSPPAQRGLLRD